MRAAIALLLALLAAWPLAVAQGPPPGASEARLHVLHYHPYPDAGDPNLGKDPFGYPAAEGADWMRSRYGAYWFPTARFDGVLESSYARDGTITGMREFYERYAALVAERAREDTPAGLHVSGRFLGENATVTVRVNPIATLPSEKVLLRVVVFEDEVPYDGGNGVLVHRFLARATLPEERVKLVAGANATIERAFSVPDDWARGKLGVVAYLQNEDETATAPKPGEVLQAATYRFAQEGPTIQRQKGVLLEMYTATWCPSCVYGDGAADLLAGENGQPALHVAAEGFAYLRPPSLAAAGLGALAGLVVAFLVTPRGGAKGD